MTVAVETYISPEISPFFSIEETKYGGRGCFSAHDIIPKDIVVHSCLRPLSTTITKQFRKEVCHWCHKYDNGNNMKVKLSNGGKSNNVTIGFCSQECLDLFHSNDFLELYSKPLLAIETAYIGSLKNKTEESDIDVNAVLTDSIVEQAWKDVDEWDERLCSIKKPSKRIGMVPKLDEDDYLEAKYILGVLFQMYKIQKTHDETDAIRNYMVSELAILPLLQSNEAVKLIKYPYLLDSFVRIFKFVRLSFPMELQQFITIPFIRGLLGKELGNAFGLWSQTVNETEDKEFLGFSLYPSASFFNHSCDPNLKRVIQSDGVMVFRTLREIKRNEEMCINYGNSLNDSVEERQKNLREWFFDCGCDKCQRELEMLNI